MELMFISIIVSTRSNLTHVCDFQLFILLPQFTEITFFVCTINKSESKLKFRQTITIAKGFLKLPNFNMLLKQKNPSLLRNLAFKDFWQIANSVLNKCKFAIPPLFNGLEVLSSASDKKKLRKTLWPFFMDRVQLPQGQSHFEEAVYFFTTKFPEIPGTHFYQPRKDERLT